MPLSSSSQALTDIQLEMLFNAFVSDRTGRVNIDRFVEHLVNEPEAQRAPILDTRVDAAFSKANRWFALAEASEIGLCSNGKYVSKAAYVFSTVFIFKSTFSL